MSLLLKIGNRQQDIVKSIVKSTERCCITLEVDWKRNENLPVGDGDRIGRCSRKIVGVAARLPVLKADRSSKMRERRKCERREREIREGYCELIRVGGV